MSSSRRTNSRRSKPLDASRLRDLALSYVSRFSTTGAKLESYLARKIRERGVVEDDEGRAVDLKLVALVQEFVDQGYVDDDAYARAKARDLNARGYGARRVDQALRMAGVGEQVRHDHAPSVAARRRAAMVMAQKRRFGPFAQAEVADRTDPKLREKQFAAMLRAGHDMDLVRFILHSATIGEVEDWLLEAEQEEQEGGEQSQW